MESYDVVVIGGGPAGSTIGRLLAEWGHSVLILSKSDRGKRSLAESLPPSSRKLFGFLGILEPIDQADFYRSSGNTVWWGKKQGRVEKFHGPPQTWGYQVQRRHFDHLLLDLAARAGAHVCTKAAVRRVNLTEKDWASIQCEEPEGRLAKVHSRFVLDCSGRAGVIASKGLRSADTHYKTQAITAVWRREAGWPLKDETHTLVEAYEDGWAWSVPTSPSVRYFTVMVDVRATKMARGRGLPEVYRTELSKTKEFRKILCDATLASPPWGCDASLYTAQGFAGPHFLLVGDAASFIDPLSSFGVKKALASAWIAAVVVNTCLNRPEMQQTALEFHDQRERQVYARYRRLTAQYASEAAGQIANRFWIARSEAATGLDSWELDQEDLKRDPAVLDALEALKKSPAIALHKTKEAHLRKKTGILGNEIILEDAVVTPNLPSGLRFLDNVNLPVLLEIAGKHRQVPDLFEAYNRECPPVELRSFLFALSFLLAKGILVNRCPSTDR